MAIGYANQSPRVIALDGRTQMQFGSFTHSRQQGVSGCRHEDLEQFAGRHRIFCIPLYILPPTENFFVQGFVSWFDVA